MNPMNSTNAIAGRLADTPDAKAAYAEPYEADLKHFLDLVPESEPAKGGTESADPPVGLLHRTWRRIRIGLHTIAVSLGLSRIRKRR